MLTGRQTPMMEPVSTKVGGTTHCLLVRSKAALPWLAMIASHTVHVHFVGGERGDLGGIVMAREDSVGTRLLAAVMMEVLSWRDV